MNEDDRKTTRSRPVLDFESPQAITGIFERFRKVDIARHEFCRQRVRCRDLAIRVAACDALLDASRVVRYWIDADVLEHDHCAARFDNSEEDAVRVGPLETDVGHEPVAMNDSAAETFLTMKNGAMPVMCGLFMWFMQ
jgi:hypothetical protein